MAAGQITFRCNVLDLSVVVWMGDDPPKVTGGYGGWEIIERPRRTAVTQWQGREPIQMEIQFVLDGWKRPAGRRSIEYDVTALERMALPHKTQPPVIKIIGSAMPHSDLDYVIQNIDWGPAIRAKNGERFRQEGTITLVRYLAADKLKFTAAQQKRQSKGRPVKGKK